MIQLFSTLDRLTIKPAADGLVAVTVLLPPELVRDYCRFLESLADFLHTVDRKIKIERALVNAATCAVQIEEGQRRRSEYRARPVRPHKLRHSRLFQSHPHSSALRRFQLLGPDPLPVVPITNIGRSTTGSPSESPSLLTMSTG